MKARNQMNKSKVEIINIYSNILGKEMAMSVYLPEQYSNKTPSLPVLYFFHGRSGNEKIITQLNMQDIADKMIQSNQIKPMIIVCPRIENSRGVNSSLICTELSDGQNKDIILNIGMYEDYFINEIVPLIDTNYNTIKGRNGRYIGGASAGGYTALHNAFRHQNMFSKVGGHMPAIELELEEDAKPYFKDVEAWKKYDPISIAMNNDISNIDVYLDAGDNDEGEFYNGCSILHKTLIEKKVNSQNHVFPGHHNIEYIKSNLEKYLGFYGK